MSETHAFGPVSLEVHDGALAGLATVTLADPDRRNIMGPPMFDGLEASILQLEALTAASRFHALREPPPARAVRVVRVRALGSAFCAGFDLGLLAEDPDPAQPLLASFLRRLAGCTRRLRALPAVSVAVVQGPALAGGCALAMACDLAIGGPSARFGYPVHAIGLSPAVSGPVLDARVGSGATRAMFVGGEPVDAERALHLGLLHRLAPDADTLASTAEALAAKLLASGPHALAATKRWLLDLDRSIDPQRSAQALQASLSSVGSEASRQLLRSAWNARRKA
jgi:methylglutaconyl-CoA hydratase